MDHDMTQPTGTTDFVLGKAEALLAGTLALMTALVQGCCDEHRPALRRKVISNLAELEQHPALSAQFRAMASHLQQHWFAIDSGRSPRGCADARLWHEPSGAVH